MHISSRYYVGIARQAMVEGDCRSLREKIETILDHIEPDRLNITLNKILEDASISTAEQLDILGQIIFDYVLDDVVDGSGLTTRPRCCEMYADIALALSQVTPTFNHGTGDGR